METKLSRCVNKFLIFEDWPSSNFQIEIFREFGQNLVFLVHIFLFLTLDAQKIVEMEVSQWN